MSITFDAVYENGVLRPVKPLPLKESQMVHVTIDSEISCADRTAGILKWTGDPDVLRQLAEGDEFGVLESR
jgi:predicted DNA-binding antitoxin AbrB/MazE fold protein